MASKKKNIVIVDLDDFNLPLLAKIRNANDYNFLNLFSYRDIVRPKDIDPEHLLARADRELAMLSRVDAIVGYWDFPTSTILPILRQRLGLPGPSLEAVLKCEHKYWSRLEQRAVAPEVVPAFCAFDPFDDNAANRLDLAFPCWIKPVTAHSSYLGLKVRNKEEFEAALPCLRHGIAYFGEPLDAFLECATLPQEVASLGGHACIAEEIISKGSQCTLECFVLHNEVVTYGVVDSLREGKHRSSFQRYQYPSHLPTRVVERMVDATEKVVDRIGLDNTPFNIEFYWDRRADTLRLLEINTRISKSHCPLFWMVDGMSHHEVMVEVALGNRPAMPYRQGRHELAAKFMLRRFEDGIVTRTPAEEDVRTMQRKHPDAMLRLIVSQGMRLSDVWLRDSYSYEFAELFLGGTSQKQLLASYRDCLDILDFRFAPVNILAA
jgi:biotin carboxylase